MSAGHRGEAVDEGFGEGWGRFPSGAIVSGEASQITCTIKEGPWPGHVTLVTGYLLIGVSQEIPFFLFYTNAYRLSSPQFSATFIHPETPSIFHLFHCSYKLMLLPQFPFVTSPLYWTLRDIQLGESQPGSLGFDTDKGLNTTQALNHRHYCTTDPEIIS